MDMSNVKSIFDNTANKAVKKITDGNGNVLWQSATAQRKINNSNSDNVNTNKQ